MAKFNRFGTAGNDLFHSTGATDEIDGLGGIDTIVFPGNLAKYQITTLGGVTTVQPLNHGASDRAYTLLNFERLEFKDQTVLLPEHHLYAGPDPAGPQHGYVQAYVTTFGGAYTGELAATTSNTALALDSYRPGFSGSFLSRGIMEFDVTGASSDLQGASLILTPAAGTMFHSSGLDFAQKLEVYAYAGNGVVDTGDYHAGVLVGSAMVERQSSETNAISPVTLNLDVSVLEAVLAQPGDWLGLAFGTPDIGFTGGFFLYGSGVTLDLVF